MIRWVFCLKWIVGVLLCGRLGASSPCFSYEIVEAGQEAPLAAGCAELCTVLPEADFMVGIIPPSIPNKNLEWREHEYFEVVQPGGDTAFFYNFTARWILSSTQVIEYYVFAVRTEKEGSHTLQQKYCVYMNGLEYTNASGSLNGHMKSGSKVSVSMEWSKYYFLGSFQLDFEPLTTPDVLEDNKARCEIAPLILLKLVGVGGLAVTVTTAPELLHTKYVVGIFDSRGLQISRRELDTSPGVNKVHEVTFFNLPHSGNYTAEVFGEGDPRCDTTIIFSTDSVYVTVISSTLSRTPTVVSSTVPSTPEVCESNIHGRLNVLGERGVSVTFTTAQELRNTKYVVRLYGESKDNLVRRIVLPTKQGISEKLKVDFVDLRDEGEYTAWIFGEGDPRCTVDAIFYTNSVNITISAPVARDSVNWNLVIISVSCFIFLIILVPVLLILLYWKRRTDNYGRPKSFDETSVNLGVDNDLASISINLSLDDLRELTKHKEKGASDPAQVTIQVDSADKGNSTNHGSPRKL